MKIISPIDGDMLHARDGIAVEGGLQITVMVAGEPVNVVLKDYRNVLELGDEKIVVYWVKDFAGGYRLSIDDNIWFIRDIYYNAGIYRSIFDNPYLAFLKKVNKVYGTKIHLNLFYQTEGFNLSLLSDEFVGEWKAQADWLRLSFHALGEFPDKPYIKAGYEQMKKDCELVMREIRRFAGTEIMGPVTTVHWGEATVEGVRALRDLGYRGLLGYFNVDDELPEVSYYLDVEQRRHIKRRFIWKDNASDMVFVRSSIVIDKTPLVGIRPHLDGGGLPAYVDLLVHEQYYYPFYFNYQPDYEGRILTAVQWAQDNGYKPRFLEECIF